MRSDIVNEEITEEIYEDSYGFDCECAEDEFIRKMETLEEIEQLQQENTELKAKLSSIEEYCEKEFENCRENIRETNYEYLDGMRFVVRKVLEILRGNNND